MAIPVTSNNIRLSSGRVIELSHEGVIGVDAQCNIFGAFGKIPLEETTQMGSSLVHSEAWTAEELCELADLMIEHWRAFKAKGCALDHEWGRWIEFSGGGRYRNCHRCGHSEEQTGAVTR